MFRAEGSIPVIGDRSALLPDHYSVADGALFIILIKTSRPLFRCRWSIVHYIDKNDDISFYNTLRRAEFRPQIEFDHVQH